MRKLALALMLGAAFPAEAAGTGLTGTWIAVKAERTAPPRPM